jgi:hypothetical protein
MESNSIDEDGIGEDTGEAVGALLNERTLVAFVSQRKAFRNCFFFLFFFSFFFTMNSGKELDDWQCTRKSFEQYWEMQETDCCV